jgi:GntR family transcriptional regulator
MIPFRLTFHPGEPICDQVVYAAKKAIIAGNLRPGDAFPSVRALSKHLKINPNTAHKVVAQLLAEEMLEVIPGIGTTVKNGRTSTPAERKRLLHRELEQLVVEAKKIGLERDTVAAALTKHWDRLDGSKKPE